MVSDACRPELKGTGLGIGKSSGFKYADFVAPPEVDWRKKGAVSEVKNQQQVRLHVHLVTKRRKLERQCNAPVE